MGSRCWECGDKVGRCYEHGSSECGCISCRCTITTVDVGYVHVLTEHGGPCVDRCPHPDHEETADE